jgi:hypothetical protein
MLRVTANTPDAHTYEFPTVFEAAFRVFDLAVESGCRVEDTHSGRIFEITHVADRLPRVTAPATTEFAPEELKAA